MIADTEIRLLGPIELLVGGSPVDPGPAKQRAVLAMLALEANQVVSADRLMDGLWEERLPPTAAKMVQHYIWQLRRTLRDGADAEIVTRGRGYELRIDDEHVDARRFRALLTATDSAGNGQLREALKLWRGRPLEDIAGEPFAAVEIRRLEALRLDALERAAEHELAERRPRDALALVDELLSADPLRERAHALRILALYRAGRQAEALSAYQAARAILVDELGVEPGPGLQRLQAAVLRHDPELEPPRPAAAVPPELAVAGLPPVSGRDEELAILMTVWQRGRAGEGSVVALSGAPGMGKTRLAAELAAEAATHGAAVVYAGASTDAGEAAARVEAAASAERPALLVADDVDRCGAELRVAVEAAVAGASQRSLVVVATARDPQSLPAAPHHLALLPLNADSARRVAAYYGFGEVPAETLMQASRGVPGELVRAAATSACDDAARRVEAAAADASAGRSDLRSAEAAVAASVLDLERARSRARRALPSGARVDACPYKGLATFESADADRFFGRERLVATLVARLAGASLVALIGASGTGKSSVVRAGLLPALAAGVLPGSERWVTSIVRPGSEPHEALRAAAEGLNRPSVLVVDQLEELFTASHDPAQRASFADELVRLTGEPGIRVVLLLRSDFYGRFAVYHELAALLAESQVLVGPMTRHELRRAIEGPAERAGVVVEPELTGALIAEVEGEPGALPLLSTALVELWERGDGRHLRLADHEDSGGVRGAVARLAEAAYGQLGAPQRAAARAALLRLADVDASGALVRRRAAREEFAGPAAEVVETLTSRRLITLADGGVEVAHEALLREWPRMRDWVAEDAEHRRTRLHLANATRAWTAAARDEGELYRGARLAAALEWSARHGEGLSDDERAFLAASRAASERAARRLRALLVGTAVALVAALAAGVLALHQRASAREEARVAEAQRLGALALTGGPLDRSLLLARQGVELDDSTATRGNLLAALVRSPAAVAVATGDGHRLLAVDAAPDGRRFAAGDNHGDLLMFDDRGRRVGGAYAIPGSIFVVRFSPDGTRLAIPHEHLVDIIDARRLELVRRLSADRGVFLDRVAFSPDGRTLAADYAPADEETGTPGPGRIVRWDVRSGRRVGPERTITRMGTGLVAYTDAGTLVVSSPDDGETVVRDGRTLAPVRRIPESAFAATVSRDGRRLALGGADGTVRIIDLRDGASRALPGGHSAEILELRFTPDGSRLISAGDDGRVLLWDIMRGELVEVFEGHDGRVRGVAVGAGGRLAYSAALDGRLIAWDLTGRHRLGRRFRAGGGNPDHPHPAVAPGAIAVTEESGTVRLFDDATLAARGRLVTHGHGPATGAAFGASGRVIAVTYSDGNVTFWDPRAGRPLGAPVAAHEGAALAPGYSADGRFLVTAGEDRKVRVWDAAHRTPIATAELQDMITDVAISPDGRSVIVSTDSESGEGALELYRAQGLRRVRRQPVASGGWGRFSPDGALFLRGDLDGEATALDAHTLRPRLRIPRAHAGFVISVDADPTGQMLATGSSDGTTRLWDLHTGRPIGAPLPGVPNRWVAARFLAGGALAAVYDDGRAWRWDVRPSAWKAQACRVAGRSLTPQEWRELLPGQAYAPACASQ